MYDVSNDNNSFLMAIIFLAIGGLAKGIVRFNITGIFIKLIVEVSFAFLIYGIIHFLAIFFGGEGSFKQLFSVIGIASIIRWTIFIPVIGPILGMLLGIWTFVVLIHTLKTIYSLNNLKAILIGLTPVFFIFLLGIILLISGLGFIIGPVVAILL